MKDITPRRHQPLDDAVEVEYGSSWQAERSPLRDYWNLVLKRRYLVIIGFMLLFGFGSYIIFSATTLYTAQATLRIDLQSPAVIGIQDIQALQMSQGDYFQTQFTLLRSRPLAAKVISEQNLASNKIFTSTTIRQPNPSEWVSTQLFSTMESAARAGYALLKQGFSNFRKEQPLPPPNQPSGQTVYDPNKVNPAHIGRYLRFLKIEPVINTRLVNVSFTTPDANLSQQLANAHVTAFIRMNVDTRYKLTNDAREYLEKGLSELKSKMEEAEAKLAAFRRANGVVQVEKDDGAIISQMIDLNQKQADTRLKRIELETLVRMKDIKEIRNLAQIVENKTVQQYVSQIDALEAEKLRFSGILKGNHPRIVELETRINGVLQQMSDRISSDYAAVRIREEMLEAESKRQRQEVIAAKGLGARYAMLQSDLESNRSLYKSVLTRLTETTVASEIPVSNMYVTELADEPGRPITYGEQLRLLMITAGGALFVAVGLALGLGYFDSTVETPDAVSTALYLPTLGLVPDFGSVRHRWHSLLRLPKSKNGSVRTDLLISHHPLSAIAESYRSFRTTLLLSQEGPPPQLIVFTSPCPGDGKTMTTLNLGIALAEYGKSVLIIDADLRRGRCHAVLRRANDRGLSNILRGELSVDQALQDTGVKGLALLTRGGTTHKAPDLLGSRQMEHMIDLMRKRYEFILIDTSPIMGVSDAEVLSTMCDGFVFVMNARKTRRLFAIQALKRLEAVRANILGVLLNGIDFAHPEYRSYRKYYASYQNGGMVHGSIAVGDAPVEELGSTNSCVDQLIGPSSARTVVEPPPEELSGTVPKELFERVIQKYTHAVGPMGPLLVKEQVASMGERLETFPLNRLKELLNNLCGDILDGTLRDSFEQSMRHEVLGLGRA
jgi:capsular exopolysaccharide synthesis family protein